MWTRQVVPEPSPVVTGMDINQSERTLVAVLKQGHLPFSCLNLGRSGRFQGGGQDGQGCKDEERLMGLGHYSYCQRSI